MSLFRRPARLDELQVMILGARLRSFVILELLGGEQDGRGDIRRVKHAGGADEDRALVLHRPRADALLDFGRRPLVAVVPVERQRRGGVLGAGEDVANL